MKLATSLCTALGLVLLLAGCDATSGVTARIQEKSPVFAQLTPEQKKNIEERVIEVGYNADMVYLALGKPSNKVIKATSEGPVEMWTYRNFFAPPQGYHATLADPHQQYQAGLTPGATVDHPTGSQKPIASTRGGLQTNLNLPELESDTLYVQFFNGRVFQIKLDSQS